MAATEPQLLPLSLPQSPSAASLLRDSDELPQLPKEDEKEQKRQKEAAWQMLPLLLGSLTIADDNNGAAATGVRLAVAPQCGTPSTEADGEGDRRLVAPHLRIPPAGAGAAEAAGDGDRRFRPAEGAAAAAAAATPVAAAPFPALGPRPRAEATFFDPACIEQRHSEMKGMERGKERRTVERGKREGGGRTTEGRE